METKDILKKLIGFETVLGNQRAFEECLAYIDALINSRIGWTSREYKSNGFKTVVYAHPKYTNSDEKEFDIYLYGNIDVVPATEDKFQAVEKNEKIYGRGSADMKFGVAVALQTLFQLSQQDLEKKIALVITTDEEQGGINGAKYLVDEQKYRGKVIIGPNGTPSAEKYNVEIANKGTIHTKYFAHGEAGHGSRPWEGRNAIDTIISFYLELKTKFHHGTQEIWDSTINIGKFNGGSATNAIADEAQINIDFRYISQQQAQEYYTFEQELMKKYNVTKELIVDATNILVDNNNSYFKMYLDIAKRYIDESKINITKLFGSHDVREFFKVGVLPIIFMPRCFGNHTDNEWVMIEDLGKLVALNKEFIERFITS